jgi:hypothetical protein
MPFAAFEPARYAMGDTARCANRVNLVEMQPRGDLTSTGYALANEGREYLVLQPTDSADSFTVMLPPGTYAVEWFGVDDRTTTTADDVSVERPGPVTFGAPSEATSVVLYLRGRDGAA